MIASRMQLSKPKQLQCCTNHGYSSRLAYSFVHPTHLGTRLRLYIYVHPRTFVLGLETIPLKNHIKNNQRFIKGEIYAMLHKSWFQQQASLLIRPSNTSWHSPLSLYIHVHLPTFVLGLETIALKNHIENNERFMKEKKTITCDFKNYFHSRRLAYSFVHPAHLGTRRRLYTYIFIRALSFQDRSKIGR